MIWRDNSLSGFTCSSNKLALSHQYLALSHYGFCNKYIMLLCISTLAIAFRKSSIMLNSTILLVLLEHIMNYNRLSLNANFLNEEIAKLLNTEQN